MAISHFSERYVQRSRGQSVVAMAAYRAGDALHEESTGLQHDFSHRAVEHAEIVAPADAPAWVYDRELLWNAVEARGIPATRRDHAVLACELCIALPQELSREEQLSLVRDFLQSEVITLGLVADWTLHDARGAERATWGSPHAHVMVTARSVGPDGLAKQCARWDRAARFERWREQWAACVSIAIEQSQRAAFREQWAIDRTGRNEATIAAGLNLGSVALARAAGVFADGGELERLAPLAELDTAKDRDWAEHFFGKLARSAAE